MRLSVENLRKEYRAFASFRERIFAAATLGLYGGSIRVRALRDLNFQAGEAGGEILGIIGANGAGKSTLLRILAGNTRPTAGTLAFGGGVRSILELGVGFSPELNAVENIYYNGRLFGYPTRVLMEGLNEILEFAELKDFANRPIKTYSTGMQMRLGFALATHRRTDLLLVDEALAVGDARFQQKCLSRFREFRAAGSLIMVVSHDVNMLQALCDRILLLDEGRALFLGDPAKAREAYMELIARKSFENPDQARHLAESRYDLRLAAADGKSRDVFFAGDPGRIEIQINPEEDIRDATVGIHINDSRGTRVFGTNTHMLGRELDLPGERVTKLAIDLRWNLGPGKYTVGLSVHRGRSHASDCYLWEEALRSFEIEASGARGFEGLSWLETEIAEIRLEN